MATATKTLSFPTPITTPPLKVIIALFPGFQLLDAAGPLDMFNFLSGPPYNAPISMTFVAEEAGPVGTKLVDAPGSKWRFDIEGALGKGETVNEKWDQRFVAERAFVDVLEGLKRGEEWDVLFLPGGVGSRVLRRRVGEDGLPEGEAELAVGPLVEFTKAIAPRLGLGILTVCTGSDILGYTGLIDGRRATTNMLRYNDVSARHQGVKWVKGARWVKSPREEDRQEGKGIEIWTSAGVSAGMDLALAFIAEKFGGMDLARDIARKSEYDWSEPEDGEICRFYGRYFGVE